MEKRKSIIRCQWNTDSLDSFSIRPSLGVRKEEILECGGGGGGEGDERGKRFSPFMSLSPFFASFFPVYPRNALYSDYP